MKYWFVGTKEYAETVTDGSMFLKAEQSTMIRQNDKREQSWLFRINSELDEMIANKYGNEKATRFHFWSGWGDIDFFDELKEEKDLFVVKEEITEEFAKRLLFYYDWRISNKVYSESNLQEYNKCMNFYEKENCWWGIYKSIIKKVKSLVRIGN